MKQLLWFTFVLTILQIFFTHNINAEYGCSVFCVCDIWYDLKRATCTNRHLYSIEIGISSVVEAIDLSNNSISSLSNYELAVSFLIFIYFKKNFLLPFLYKYQVLDDCEIFLSTASMSG